MMKRNTVGARGSDTTSKMVDAPSRVRVSLVSWMVIP